MVENLRDIFRQVFNFKKIFKRTMFVFWYRVRVSFQQNMSETALVHIDMILLRSMPLNKFSVVLILVAFSLPEIF